MRRSVAIAAAAVALTYFLDPDNGARRRNRVRAWLGGDSPESADLGLSNGRSRPEAVRVARPAVRPEPLVGDAATAPVIEEPASAVAVVEQPVGEATLPPPLPPDVLATPAAEDAPVVDEQSAPAESKGRGRLIGVAALVAAALAAAGLAAWSLDVFDESDGEPSSSASALSALAERQARAISIMAQPGATRLPVVGAEESLVLVVGMEGDAVLIVSRLDRAPAGQTYEVWVITGNTPAPAGLFRGGRDTVVPLTRAVPKGATVALTLEPLGGSPQPTSEPLYAVERS